MSHYMVSYWLIGGKCGNKTFPTLDEALEWAINQKPNWQSHSIFECGAPVHGISECRLVK